MPGYLLDTNTIFVLFNGEHPQHANVIAAWSARPAESPLYVSAITQGEILFGHAMDKAGESDFRVRYRAFVAKFPQKLAVSTATAEPYAEVRAIVAEKYPPPGGWSRRKRAEQLSDPVSGRELGIDENDLWLVAQAVERNLVLVTTDKMTRIREAVATIHKSFRIENWMKTDLNAQSN